MKLITILFIIIPALISAEIFKNSISGCVIDTQTDEPLENVNVYISNTTFGAATDRDGYYIIKSVPPGNHELIVSMIGYDYISEIIVLKADSEIKYNFKLNQHIFETSATEVVADLPHEWLDNPQTLQAQFTGISGSAFNIIDRELPDDGGNIGAGITAYQNEMAFNINYELEFGRSSLINHVFDNFCLIFFV